jgi:hypothetical protein
MSGTPVAVNGGSLRKTLNPGEVWVVRVNP